MAMTGAILVLNAGSSSLKFTLYASSAGGPRRLLRGQIEGLTTAPAFVARSKGRSPSATFVRGTILYTSPSARSQM